MAGAGPGPCPLPAPVPAPPPLAARFPTVPGALRGGGGPGPGASGGSLMSGQGHPGPGAPRGSLPTERFPSRWFLRRPEAMLSGLGVTLACEGLAAALGFNQK